MPIEWFYTAYPPGDGGANRPQITGPGLAGPGFYNRRRLHHQLARPPFPEPNMVDVTSLLPGHPAM